MTYLTEMDKHAPHLRRMLKLGVTRVIKHSGSDRYPTYNFVRHGKEYFRYTLPVTLHRWILALDYVDGAEAVTDEYNRRHVFTLNHDRIRAALVHYEEAAAALEVK